jgi:PAS domain S-box-containing protein
VGQPNHGVMTDRWIVSEVQPILADDGSVAGAVGVSIDLLKLSSLVTESLTAREPVVLVVNSKGIVVAHHPDAPAWLGHDVGASAITRIALEQRSGTAHEKGVRGVDRLWAFAPVRGTDWTVLAGTPMEAVMAPVYRTVAFIAGLMVIGIVFVIALCIALARPISRPIAAIAAAARRMSSQDSLEHLVPAGPREIGALAGDLNHMLDRRMAAESALRTRDKDLSLLTDNYPGWVMRLDRELRFRYVNGGYMAVTGRSSQELVGTHVRDAVGELRFRKLGPLLARALEGERLSFEDERNTVADVPLLLFMTLVPDRDPAGTVQGLFVFASDITELRATECRLNDERSRLAGIVASAMDAIVTVDSRQRITLFNPAAERMFGASAADMMGRDLQVLVPPESREKQARLIAQFGLKGIARGSGGMLGTVLGLRANGEQFPIEAAISEIEVAGEKCYTAILRDITERKRAEEAVSALNAGLERRVVERTAELEAMNRELESFDYSISHDLRAPLARIRGFSEALSESFSSQLEPRALDYLGRIQASAGSMDQLVTDILSLSTLSRGELHRADVDMSAIARGVLDNLRGTTPDREVKVVVASGLRANADPGLMRALLENLLGNAWKFTSRRDEALIEFGGDLDNGTPRFFVRDNGAGFDPAFAEKLFEPFRRLHSQKEFPGTGIGLATVQRIVRRHGGRAWAEGAVDKGATIYFTLSA